MAMPEVMATALVLLGRACHSLGMAVSSSCIALAGASGFVGRSLMAALLAQHDPPRLIALSRQTRHSENAERVDWRACNLFNLRHLEAALSGASIAYYLVHAMLPSARLAQGSFDDLDLICADNFGRAARRAGVTHIVYLGGLIPAQRPLSPHLRSRLEVESALGAHGVKVTSLRAGLVIGPGGSSFNMMVDLVRRLPVLVMPQWTQSRCQPIALDDVVAALLYCGLHPEPTSGHHDVGGPDILSYADMLKHSAKVLGRRRIFVSVPVKTVRLSLWWVALVTRAPIELILPLVQSLRHDMVLRDDGDLMARLQRRALPFDAAIRLALKPKASLALLGAGPVTHTMPIPGARGVVSVQRLPLPEGRDASWVADEYARWLPKFMRPLLRVDVDSKRCIDIKIPGLGWLLLRLRFAAERSDADRQLFYITGGMLSRASHADPGRFEFRVVLEHKYALAAVHDFMPRLPWYIYTFSQALVHAMTMAAFRRHLQRLCDTPRRT
jgi:uncharacterized protein YbjT (DUF2867 family)